MTVPWSYCELVTTKEEKKPDIEIMPQAMLTRYGDIRVYSPFNNPVRSLNPSIKASIRSAQAGMRSQ